LPVSAPRAKACHGAAVVVVLAGTGDTSSAASSVSSSRAAATLDAHAVVGASVRIIDEKLPIDQCRSNTAV
jgi:hypothetical protein